MHIGSNLSSSYLSSWNRSSSEGMLPQTLLAKNIGQVTARRAAKDEYTPSTTASSNITFTPPARMPMSASSVDAAIENVMQSAGLSKEDYFNFALAIDGTGHFHSGGGIINQDAYNWDTKEQAKLGEIIDGLNRATVKGRALGEVMLEQFAVETGLDLGEERKKDSFYYTCVVYNSGLSATRSNPDDIVGMSHSFATIMRQRVTAEDTFCELTDKPKLGKDGLDDNLKALADWQSIGYEFNDVEAPWNRHKMTNDSTETSPEDSFKPLSLVAEIQQVISPVSDMMKELNRIRVNDLITQVLEANGVNLKGGDSIALLFDEQGKLSIDVAKSHIGGVTGDEVPLVNPFTFVPADQDMTNAERCKGYQTSLAYYDITNALNTAKTPDGKPLSTALREQFAAHNVDEEGNKVNRPVSFSFKYNADTDANEICEVRSGSKKTTTYYYVNTTAIRDAFLQVLDEHGLRSTDYSVGIDNGNYVWSCDVNEDKTITFPRDRCWIQGLDENALNEILTEVEAKLDMNSLFYFYESSKSLSMSPDATQWDWLNGRKGVGSFGCLLGNSPLSAEDAAQYAAVQERRYQVYAEH